jgi:hypothetical protein
MPGFLIPADLGRMIPLGVDPLTWAESNLLASPGALVARGTRVFRIPTLVPAVKRNGACIHHVDGMCAIHDVAPFGCAFFDCKTRDYTLSHRGLLQIAGADVESPYIQIWRHLRSKGLKSRPPETARAAMGLHLDASTKGPKLTRIK